MDAALHHTAIFIIFWSAAEFVKKKTYLNAATGAVQRFIVNDSARKEKVCLTCILKKNMTDDAGAEKSNVHAIQLICDIHI